MRTRILSVTVIPMVFAVLISGCTLKQGSEFEVELGLGWYMTVYQVPSMMITSGLYVQTCNWNVDCTVDQIKTYLEMQGNKSAEFWAALDDWRQDFKWIMDHLASGIRTGEFSLDKGSDCILLKQELFDHSRWTRRQRNEGACRYKG